MKPALPALALALAVSGVTACSATEPGTRPAASSPVSAPSPGATGSMAPSSPVATASAAPGEPVSTSPRATPAATVVEPTTTNTLPPPPRPSRAAPSTAGRLTAESLPVPAGWRTVVREGGAEEGYQGNGTWVHGRDPRYAAQAVISLPCSQVTRDDYPDPRAALEGTYEKAGRPGIGLVLQFASSGQAQDFFDLYVRQVRSCAGTETPIATTPSRLGLIDHRTLDDGDWTEVGARHGSRVTLIILLDPGHKIPVSQSEKLLRRITGG